VTRAVLLVGAVAWAIGALGATLLAAIGVETLEGMLSPLAIDTEALRGAIVAGAVGLAVGSLTHGAILVGLRRRRPRAWTAGILLAALLSTTFIALSTAAFTSAIATPASALALAGAGAAAAVAALGYAVVTIGLVAEKRSGTPV
jgi:heme/copper-type cytochrome/quinol oxidase subunit 3